MKKNIAFDIGEVLYRVDLQPIYDASRNLFGLNQEETERILNQAQQDLGMADVVGLFARTMHLSSLQKLTLHTAWMDCIEEVPDILDLLEKLHKNYNIALLSNIGEAHGTYMYQHAPQAIRKCIKHFSFQVGARKPTKLFFQSFLLEYPGFDGCLFVDDLDENVAAARKAGLNAQQFCLDKDHAGSAARLEKIVLDNT
jgi:HAD superfamily hydrolase (TIGR01509 family)